MAFSAGELANIATAALDYYVDRGDALKQSIQTKPMFKAFDSRAKTFPGGKGKVSLAVKGDYSGVLVGYTHDDVVTYYNPANLRRAEYPWKEHHIGLAITHTELKVDGITVNEESNPAGTTSEKSGRDVTVLVNLLEDKMDDMTESYVRNMDRLVHGDGTSDAKAIAGIGSLILAAPAAGTTGGISRTANTWWRNRAATAANAAAGGQGAITVNPTGGGALIQFLQSERRQLQRYAQGGTSWMYFAGSDFIGGLERELRANGYYTQQGFASEAAVDGAMAGVKFGGKSVEYDPTLDDMGLSKRCYIIDMKRVWLMYMIGEKMKRANPARPVDRYVFYRAITTTGVMGASQLNTSAVYDIA